ncbi:MAG: hypothetical protein JNM71_12175 [Flavobacterium lindanitolerans]|uniref:hypothetical protein n=1 Tax=Flavobacterium TaxID=237 RepID=UPI000AE0E201|nr:MULTISPECIES: hypothetical protein [Flavobacterium]MBL7868763.1 hypothetical protein [Flavobacterium lindanitolerans]
MKKSLFVFVLSLFCLNAKSQDILDVITKEVCSCASEKKDMLKDAASEKVQMQLGLCIISSFSSHEKEVTAKYGNVMEAEGAMEKLGGDVGIKMASVCPDVLMMFADMESESGEEIEEIPALTLEGKIIEIKPEQFLTVIVKDNSGRNHTFLVLTFFEDSNLFIENKLKKNDKVSIQYWEQEFYDAKARDFRYYKVIQGIKKI